ncbi:hypothetical protein [Micromonospora sp. DPT]|jgi:hypothetical protein|uniref:hypothetical protein n=1 Tax=Micromonospora sp. DPT TaxID=3142975 RepID=UPI00320926DE
MDTEDALIMTAGNRIATIAREIITGAITGQRSNMWSMVYGHGPAADDPSGAPITFVKVRDTDQLIAAFTEQYNALNLGAAAVITALAQLYADAAGISEIEALDRAQALMHVGFEI